MSRRILLIAESSTLRFLLKRSLKNSYDDIVEVRTNTDGIQQIENDPEIKGIVLNWLVTQLDEFKSLLSLLNSPPYNQLPVVLIAAQADEKAVNWVKEREHSALTLLAQFEDVPSIMGDLFEEDSEVTGILSTMALGEEPVRILFVDDSKSSRAYYVRVLERHNYVVTTAESVEDAWRVLNENPASYFDLVITDYFMPDENGHTLCRRIRKNPEMHDLLTAVMTGTYFDDVIDISLRSGAIECMFKEESDQLSVARVASMARMAKNQRSEQVERQRLSDILSSLGEGVYGVNTKGSINFVNPAALNILNYDKEEDLIGSDAHDKLHYIDENNKQVP